MGKVLHQGCTMKCGSCEGSITCPNPVNTVFKVNGQLVLLQSDQFIINVSNCLYPKQGEFPPCQAGPMTLQWQNTATKTNINGVAVLLQSSTGMFPSPLSTPIPVVISDSIPPTPIDSL